jgi:hypothetical protein
LDCQTLPPAAAHDRDIFSLLGERERPVDRTVDQNTFAIDELNKANTRLERLKGRKALIPWRAAAKGWLKSSLATEAPICRAAVILPSVEPEST